MHTRVVIVFILGPGARVLREHIRDSLAFLDLESADLAQWLLLDDPRRCRQNFESLVRHLQSPREELERRWNESVSQRADAADAISDAEMAAATALKLKSDALPAAVVLFPGEAWVPMTVPIPKAAAHDPELARRAFDLLRASFSPARLELSPPMGSRKRWGSTGPSNFAVDLCASASKALRELDPQPQSKPNRAIRAQRAQELRDQGLSLKAIARELGVSRVTVCRDLKGPREGENARVTPDDADELSDFRSDDES